MPSYPLIMIVAAVQMELQGLIGCSDLKKVSSWLWEGKYGRHPVQVVKTGVGTERAKKTLSKALERCAEDCLVINIGWAGALQPYLEVGSIVAARMVCEVPHNGRRRCLSLMDDSPFMTALSAIDFISLGTLLTISQVANREEKHSLRQQYPGALAVDMESFSIAELCQERQIPVLILRAISDTLSFHLPAGFGGSKAKGDDQPQGAGSLQRARLYHYCKQAAQANTQALDLYLNYL
jgi:adenosylhomocysteine nucleosidase